MNEYSVQWVTNQLTIAGNQYGIKSNNRSSQTYYNVDLTLAGVWTGYPEDKFG